MKNNKFVLIGIIAIVAVVGVFFMLKQRDEKPVMAPKVPETVETVENDEQEEVQQEEPEQVGEKRLEYYNAVTYDEKTLPNHKQVGEDFVYVDKDQRRLYAGKIGKSVNEIFRYEEGWKLADYAISKDGKLVFAIETRRPLQEYAHTIGYAMDLNIGAEPEKFFEYEGSETDMHIVERLHFTPDGQFIIEEWAAYEGVYVKIYDASLAEVRLDDPMYHYIMGDYGMTYLGTVEDSRVLLMGNYSDESDYTYIYENNLGKAVPSMQIVDGELWIHGNRDGLFYGLFHNSLEDYFLYREPFEIGKSLTALGEYGDNYRARLQMITKTKSNVKANSSQEEIQVSTTHELVQAIGSNRRIVLKPGTYNLTTAVVGDGPVQFTEKGLTISDVENLTIQAQDPSYTQLVTANTAHTVMNFVRTKNIVLEGLSIAHFPRAVECSGDVLSFDTAEQVQIKHTILFGSGSYGLNLNRVKGLTFDESMITDLSKGIFIAHESTDVKFLSSGIYSNQGGVKAVNSSGIIAKDCEWNFNRSSDVLFDLENSQLTLEKCTLLGNEATAFEKHEKSVTLIDSTLKDNDFNKSSIEPYEDYSRAWEELQPSELDLNGLAPLDAQFTSKPKTREIIRRPYPVTKIKGDHSIGYYINYLNNIDYINTNTGAIKSVLSFENSWNLISYDVNDKGLIVMAFEESVGNKADETLVNHTKVLLVDMASEGRKIQIVVDRRSNYATPDYYEVQSVEFSYNGQYLVVNSQGKEKKQFELYAVNSFNGSNLMGEVQQLLADAKTLQYIGLRKDSSELVFKDLTTPQKPMIYIYNLAKKKLKNLNKDTVSKYEFVASDGTIYFFGPVPNTSNLPMSVLSEKGISSRPGMKSSRETLLRQGYEKLLPAWDAELVNSLTTGMADAERVTVKNVEELIQVIAPNRIITLEKGRYDLNGLAPQKTEYVTVNGDAPAVLSIHDVENLTLMSTGNGEVELTIDDPTRRVLDLQNVKNVNLIGLSMGHMAQALDGSVYGGVLELKDSNTVTLANCYLFGSGLEALVAQSVEKLVVKNSVITECGERISRFNESNDIEISNSQFVNNGNNRSPLIFVTSSNGVQYTGCKFTENRANGFTIFDIDAFSEVTMTQSEIAKNQANSLANSKYAIELETTTFLENNFSN